jgi:hypothetical protein
MPGAGFSGLGRLSREARPARPSASVAVYDYPRNGAGTSIPGIRYLSNMPEDVPVPGIWYPSGLATLWWAARPAVVVARSRPRSWPKALSEAEAPVRQGAGIAGCSLRGRESLEANRSRRPRAVREARHSLPYCHQAA